jgi:hypothetical protein
VSRTTDIAMRRARWIPALGLALSLSAAAAHADDAPPDADETHPTYSTDVRWARPALLAIAGLFAAAAVVGPLVWMRSRDTVPVAASHEEDPAADRH